MPVREGGKVVGVVYGGTDNNHLADNTTNKVDLGDAGLAFVVNMDGIIVQHPDPKRIGQNEKEAPWMARLLRQKNGRIEFADANGREKVLYFMPSSLARRTACASEMPQSTVSRMSQPRAARASTCGTLRP